TVAQIAGEERLSHVPEIDRQARRGGLAVDLSEGSLLDPIEVLAAKEALQSGGRLPVADLPIALRVQPDPGAILGSADEAEVDQEVLPRRPVEQLFQEALDPVEHGVGAATLQTGGRFVRSPAERRERNLRGARGAPCRAEGEPEIPARL